MLKNLLEDLFMEWYHILLIALGSLIVVASLVFLIIYLVSKSSKEKSKTAKK